MVCSRDRVLNRSRGSEAPDSHLCKYQSYDVAALVQRAARRAKDAEDNYIGTTAETTTPQYSPTDTNFNISNLQLHHTSNFCLALGLGIFTFNFLGKH